MATAPDSDVLPDLAVNAQSAERMGLIRESVHLGRCSVPFIVALRYFRPSPLQQTKRPEQIPLGRHFTAICVTCERELLSIHTGVQVSSPAMRSSHALSRNILAASTPCIPSIGKRPFNRPCVTPQVFGFDRSSTVSRRRSSRDEVPTYCSASGKT